MVWVGIDDTDSPAGGCTTWALTELVREAGALGLALVAEPRLVRLNPNIPWRTRGNAALAARFGIARGRGRTIGTLGGHPVRMYPGGRPLRLGEAGSFLARAWECVRDLAPEVEGTDPALVATERPLASSLYWAAVREVVDPHEVETALARSGAVVHWRGSNAGVVGASAAIAWPGRRVTWEGLAYRPRARWGAPRTVDAASVRAVARQEPALFLCDDPRTRRLLVVPHTPCPILFGLRGREPRAVRRAVPRIRSEPVDRWLVFRTNQGTGDHLVRRRFAGFGPLLSGETSGTVRGSPEALTGGHVRFAIADEADGVLSCLAYEPTKTLPGVAAQLHDGDRVTVWGSVGERPGLRLEGLRIDRLQPVTRREKPRCRDCLRPSRSLGADRGYRCPSCGRRWPPEAAIARAVRRGIARGVIHPTPSARRHLARLAPEA
jgi:tRNA(Ile2)-agmatinylcytidine synthase